MGAKALVEAHWFGDLNAMVSAPWPPMLCPQMDLRPGAAGRFASMSAGSSWVT